MDTDASADSATRQTKRQKVEDDQWTALGSVDHDGHTYHVGDHVILDDTDNSSGARGTDLPAIGHVQGIQRSQQGTVLVTVAWYVHPRLTPHPPYMEFYQDAILRTFRQSQVPVERIQKACFVVQPTEYMSGRPGEWKEGDRIFVCDSRFVDRGQFIQKIKHWNKGFWPEHMDPGRKEMLTNMVPWSEGPRTLEKSVLEARPTEGSDGSMPQRRVTRMAATPTKVTTAENPGTPAVSASVPHGASPATAQAQLLAFQQMMSQGRMDMPTGGNANGQNQQQMLLLMQQQAQAHVDLGAAAADTRAIGFWVIATDVSSTYVPRIRSGFRNNSVAAASWSATQKQAADREACDGGCGSSCGSSGRDKYGKQDTDKDRNDSYTATNCCFTIQQCW
ncbi:hypothetical protein GGI07_001453 [Coemansia sp. Benny D115]|nr:hypothetical protein GGI07_001453 [Coemansia sp. Benny D115]